jgi:hypothetical protein
VTVLNETFQDFRRIAAGIREPENLITKTVGRLAGGLRFSIPQIRVRIRWNRCQILDPQKAHRQAGSNASDYNSTASGALNRSVDARESRVSTMTPQTRTRLPDRH